MQAAIYVSYGSADVVKVRDIANPSPGPDQVLVKIHATSVTPVDTAFRSGTPLIARLFTGLRRPRHHVLGTELAGEIEAVGAAVTRFETGQRVFAAAPGGFGAHAQYICLSQDAAIVAMPETLDYEDAAVVCNGALTALAYLRDHAKLQPGQDILIIGAAGSIGTAAVQLAARMGARVTGVCSTLNLEMVRDLGAAEVIDYTVSDFRTRGRKYDVIFDTVGKSSFRQARPSLSATGIYLTTVPDPGTLISPLLSVLRGRKRAKMAATGLRPDRDKIADMAYLVGLMAQGDLTMVIDRGYPLQQIAAAHAYVERGHKRGNLVINVSHQAAA
jgi:NADPH:quinone reductase-like Zn-dependent oxidoreductase